MNHGQLGAVSVSMRRPRSPFSVKALECLDVFAWVHLPTPSVHVEIFLAFRSLC